MRDTYVPEFVGVSWINIFGVLRNGGRVCLEKKIFDFTLITVQPDIPAPVSIGVGGPRPFLIGFGPGEELVGFLLHPGNNLLRHTMVDHFEETVFFASFHNPVCGFRPVRAKVYDRELDIVSYFLHFHWIIIILLLLLFGEANHHDVLYFLDL